MPWLKTALSLVVLACFTILASPVSAQFGGPDLGNIFGGGGSFGFPSVNPLGSMLTSFGGPGSQIPSPLNGLLGGGFGPGGPMFGGGFNFPSIGSGGFPPGFGGTPSFPPGPQGGGNLGGGSGFNFPSIGSGGFPPGFGGIPSFPQGPQGGGNPGGGFSIPGLGGTSPCSGIRPPFSYLEPKPTYAQFGPPGFFGGGFPPFFGGPFFGPPPFIMPPMFGILPPFMGAGFGAGMGMGMGGPGGILGGAGLSAMGTPGLPCGTSLGVQGPGGLSLLGFGSGGTGGALPQGRCIPNASNTVKAKDGSTWLSPSCTMKISQGCSIGRESRPNAPYLTHTGNNNEAVDFEYGIGKECGQPVYAPVDGFYHVINAQIGPVCQFETSLGAMWLVHLNSHAGCNGQKKQGDVIGTNGCRGLAQMRITHQGGPCHIHISPANSAGNGYNPFCQYSSNPTPWIDQTDGCFY